MIRWRVARDESPVRRVYMNQPYRRIKGVLTPKWTSNAKKAYLWESRKVAERNCPEGSGWFVDPAECVKVGHKWVIV